MRRFVCNTIFGLIFTRHSHLFSVACATQFPWGYGVVMMVAMLVIGVNDCEASSVYIWL